MSLNKIENAVGITAKAIFRRLPWIFALTVWTGLAVWGQKSWFNGWWLIGALALAWTAWCWLRRRALSATMVEVVVGWWLLRLPGLFSGPVLEDDPYRYLWDGRQFALSGNPYATAPAEHFQDDSVPAGFQEILDQVNYPDVPTIYGPVCEWGFMAGYLVAPGRLWPWKMILVGLEWGIWIGLHRLVGHRRVWWFASCPLAVFETSFNAHPEAVGIVLMVMGLVLARRRAWVMAGLALGIASGARIFALLAVPFVLRRGDWRGWAGFLGGLVACYLPFWVRGSLADWAGLRTFAAEWEFNSSVFSLLTAVFGRLLAQKIAGLLLVMFCLGQWLRERRDAPEHLFGGEWVYGVFFLLGATVNPWYLLWLLPFVAARPTITGITALAVVSLSYLYGANVGANALGFDHQPWVRLTEYGSVALAASWEWLNRSNSAGPSSTSALNSGRTWKSALPAEHNDQRLGTGSK